MEFETHHCRHKHEMAAPNFENVNDTLIEIFQSSF